MKTRLFYIVLRIDRNENLIYDKAYKEQTDGFEVKDWINHRPKPAASIEAIFDDGIGEGYPFEIRPDISNHGSRIFIGRLSSESQATLGFNVSLLITEKVHEKSLSYGYHSKIENPRQEPSERSRSLFRK